MNWKNTKLIFRRELSDQWRDRRTIFTIIVMPLVLYPLMGMALLQTAQFMKQDAPNVMVVGENNLPAEPKLLSKNGFDKSLFPGQADSTQIKVTYSRQMDEAKVKNFNELLLDDSPESMVDLQRFMKQQNLDLVVQVTPCETPNPTSESDDSGAVLQSEVTIKLFTNSTSDQSALAVGQVSQLIDRWKSMALQKKLSDLGLMPKSLAGVQVKTVDTSSKTKRKAAMWAKLLPFIVLIWALTGAFYPAIDLCAGEKERGTLETLLSSPARRSEIVTGKLLTVASFSFATAMLNLVSMTVTGLFVMTQLSAHASTGGLPVDMGFPPLWSLPWLVIGLIPICALFSSLALALAAFAKSSKEGQYYLVPLLMSLVPLMMLSMLPGARLDLGTSLIPVTGMLLLLKNLMLAEYAVAMQFVGPVLAITLVCCWMAARWAIFQFNSESVMFRSGEQFGVGTWLRHLVRDRGPLPSFGEAVLCGVMILVIKFFVGLSAQLELTFAGFARQVVITQVATIALPAILFALFLTRGPRETMKLNWPRVSYVPACILMAILLHPGFVMLSELVMYLYPPSGSLDQLQTAVSMILSDAPNTWAIIAVLALVPAICEEVAFRGFILSGLQTIRGKWTAIIISALFFGIAHGILQQSIMATFVGVVLGVIAVQTRSLLPCIAYHLMHNALPILMSVFPTHSVGSSYMKHVLQVNEGGGIEYTLMACIVMPMMGIGLLVWLWKFSEQRTEATDYLGFPAKPAVAQ